MNTLNACTLAGQCKTNYGFGNLAGTCAYTKCTNQLNCADACLANNNAAGLNALCEKLPTFVCKASGSALTYGAYLILALLAFFLF